MTTNLRQLASQRCRIAPGACGRCDSPGNDPWSRRRSSIDVPFARQPQRILGPAPHGRSQPARQAVLQGLPSTRPRDPAVKCTGAGNSPTTPGTPTRIPGRGSTCPGKIEGFRIPERSVAGMPAFARRRGAHLQLGLRANALTSAYCKGTGVVDEVPGWSTPAVTT